MAGNELSQGKGKRNFGQTAAKASLVAVILLWIIRAMYSGPPQSDTLEMGKYYAEILGIVVRVCGIACAIIALLSIPRYGIRGILVTALLGLFGNSAYFIYGGHKRLPILRAYARGVDKGGVDRGIAAARVAAAPTKEVITYSTIDFLQLEKEKAAALSAAESASDENALVLRAWAATLEDVMGARRRAAEAEQKLIAATVLDVASIKSTEDFVRRRWIANDWATRMHEAGLQLRGLPTVYRRCLAERGVSSARSALEADRIAANPPRKSLETAMALYVAEQNVATRFNLAVSALEDEWNAASDRASFQPRADSAAWKGALEALATAQNTLKLQREQLGVANPWPTQ